MSDPTSATAGASAAPSTSTAYSGTFGQIEALWIANGGPPAWAATMAAIAMAESGGDASATNSSGATGIWQIMWPLHKGVVPCATSQNALEDANCNAQAAVALVGGGAGFCSGWGTTAGGNAVGIALCGGSAKSQPAPYSFSQAVAWAKGLGMNVSDAFDPANTSQAVLTGWESWVKNILSWGVAPLSPVTGPVSSVLGLSDLISGTTGIVEDVTSPTWWKRIGVGALGVVLVVGGVVLFISTTGEGKKIEETAATAAVLA
jgi:hypothetical protein